MSLKLFRSTGYSSILVPGETRVAMHPGWVVLATSLWIGFACNVALWREFRTLSAAGVLHALLAGAFVAGACCTLLSLLGWRRTLKPATTMLLLLAALLACGVWVRAVPLDAGLVLDKGRMALVLPPWASLFRWQVPALLIILGLLPMIWLWNTQLRRLPGPQQLASNAVGMGLGLAVLAGTGILLFGGLR